MAGMRVGWWGLGLLAGLQGSCEVPSSSPRSQEPVAPPGPSVSFVPPGTNVPVAPPSAAPLSETPGPSSGRCQPGMVEVEGRHCKALMHRCTRGGRTYQGKPDGSWMPYFCEEYEVGFARCLGEETPLHFCMDRYEFPNHQGEIPRVMVSWYEARALCEAQGKRLCGDDEWTLACEGPERRPFAYGWARDATACNIDRPWIAPDNGALASKKPEKIEAEVARLSQRVPSGSMPRCSSPFGVMDLGGNVDEWTVNVTLGGRPFRSMFKGGHWCKGARNRCRPTTESHDETTAYYAEGFRCCGAVAP
jgi:sulfatase modifying factor 1